MSGPSDSKRPPHPVVIAVAAIARWAQGKAGALMLAIALLLLCGAWLFVKEIWDATHALQAATQSVPARVTASYWRVLDPPAQYADFRLAQITWYSRFDFVPGVRMATTDANGRPIEVDVDDPQGKRSGSTWPPRERFEKQLPHAGTELRFERATLARYRAEPPKDRYGASSRPDWRKSEYDAIVDDIDDPLRETVLEWTHPASRDVPLLRDPAHPDMLLLRGGGSEIYGFGPLIFGPGAKAVFLAGFGLVFSALGLVGLSGGKRMRGYFLGYTVVLAALPWWSPHVLDVVRWLSPEVGAAVEREMGGIAQLRTGGAPLAAPAMKVDDEAVIRYDAERSAYARVWRRFQLVRPADCCGDVLSAYREMREQLSFQTVALDDDAVDSLARDIVDLESKGHGHVTSLFLPAFDRISRDSKRRDDVRESATTVLRWATRFSDVDREFYPAWAEDLKPLAAHPDRDVAAMAAQGLKFTQ